MATFHFLGPFGIPEVGELMLGILLVVIFLKGLFRTFPIFTAYVGFELFSSVAIGAIRSYSKYGYFYSYWMQSLISTLLGLAVIAEIYAVALKPYAGIRRLWLRISTGVALLLLMFSVCIVAIAPASDHPFARITVFLIELDRSGEFFRFGMVFLLFAASGLFGIRLRHYLFGIALGIGISTGTLALINSVRVQLGWAAGHFWVNAAPIGYDLGTLVWIYFCARSEAVEKVREAPFADGLERWNVALEHLLAR